ncbi:beta-2-glycoprotein 1-like, partial [Sceloporus undulatus]|uniref:beta-2-glycoprotein 1-like n=1 Tax=Sceloporus undulatus TaxID=8520 RepID=UPI001C4AF933
NALSFLVCPRPPAVPFASVSIAKAEYNVGEKIIYHCQPGYLYQSGKWRYTCPFTGRWPSISIKCVAPKKCNQPEPLMNGNVHFTGLDFMNFANYSCDSGYILRGYESRLCQADGQWSEKLPKCHPVICPPPPVSEFSVLSYQRLKPGNISVFQDEINFQCLLPYVLFGNETAVCQADGNWSALPECKAVECSQPEDIENGYIYLLLRRAYRYKETVTYGCNPTYVLDGPTESRCEKTGQWSTKPICRAPCAIPVKKATVLYNNQKVKLQDHFQNGIQHAESIWFFCKNKEQNCSYKVAAQCDDGNFTVPACFKERGWFASYFKTDIADLSPCETAN